MAKKPSRSQTYWEARSLERLILSEEQGNELNNRLFKIYDQAFRNVNREVEKVYKNYAQNGILSKEQLATGLTPEGRRSFLKAVSESAKNLGIDPDDMYDERYLLQLTRLEALKEQVRMKIYEIAPESINASEQEYLGIVENAYSTIQADLEFQGLTPSFTTLDKAVADAVLRSEWVGGNYSSRIWGNVDQLAEELPILLGGALTSGQSYQKTARILRERYDVSKYRATTLVRTESNYLHNQAELQSYVDDGISKYEYDAMMDNRTTKICRSLNRKIFLVKDAVPGKNYPPMHPNCRSTTVVVLVQDAELALTFEARTDRLNVGPSNETIANRWRKKIIG